MQERGSEHVDGSAPTAGRLLPLLVLAGGLLLAGACDNPLAVVPDPDNVNADQPVPLPQVMTGATFDLFKAYDVKVLFSGLFGDEFVNSGTALQDWDRRDLDPDCCAGNERGQSLDSPNYVPMQRAVRVAEIAQQRIRDGDFDAIEEPPEDSPEFARVSMYSGFARVWLADLFCSVAFNGTGPELTSQEVYELAEEEFTQALQADAVQDEVRQAALVGRARVRLILGDDAGAASDASQVDPGFEFRATFSTNTFEQRNRVWYHTWQFRNWSVAPRFRGLTVDDTGNPDPRVDLADNPADALDPSQELFTPHKAGQPSSPMVIASGDEAQYVLAEVQGGSAAVDIINEVRQRNGISTQWSPTGDGANEIRDKLIEERARTLFLEGVHLGDLRRYLDKYDLNLFPTSTPQGFSMGDQTCVPLPNVERDNNPDI